MGPDNASSSTYPLLWDRKAELAPFKARRTGHGPDTLLQRACSLFAQFALNVEKGVKCRPFCGPSLVPIVKTYRGGPAASHHSKRKLKPAAPFSRVQQPDYTHLQLLEACEARKGVGQLVWIGGIARPAHPPSSPCAPSRNPAAVLCARIAFSPNEIQQRHRRVAQGPCVRLAGCCRTSTGPWRVCDGLQLSRGQEARHANQAALALQQGWKARGSPVVVLREQTSRREFGCHVAVRLADCAPRGVLSVRRGSGVWGGVVDAAGGRILGSAV
jgi:hypothetical protein